MTHFHNVPTLCVSTCYTIFSGDISISQSRGTPLVSTSHSILLPLSPTLHPIYRNPLERFTSPSSSEIYLDLSLQLSLRRPIRRDSKSLSSEKSIRSARRVSSLLRKNFRIHRASIKRFSRTSVKIEKKSARVDS